MNNHVEKCNEYGSADSNIYHYVVYQIGFLNIKYQIVIEYSSHNAF